MTRIPLPLLFIGILSVSSNACSGQSDGPLPGPTAVSAAGVSASSALTVCGVEVTSFSLDTDLSGPYVVVSMGFAGSPPSLQFELERYLDAGGTDPVGSASSSDGRARIGAAFNTRYRVRGRGSCGETSQWMDIQIGPPNPCGSCGPATLPPPPPPPAPPGSGDGGKCSKDGDGHKKDRDGDRHRRRFGGGHEHDKCRD